MAGRVNTKFVILLGAVLITLVALVAGLAHWRSRTDPAENIRKGDQFLAQGQYAQALEQFGKAINNKGAKTPDLLMKFADTALKTPAADRDTARRYIGQACAMLDQAMSLAPQDLQPFGRLMEIYYTRARDLHDTSAWSDMYKLAHSTLQRDPNRILARKYRGMAQVNNMRTVNVSDELRKTAREDLEAWLKSQPDDPPAVHHLALWHLLEARQSERVSNAELARKHRQTAQKVSADALARHPQETRRQLDHAILLIQTADLKDLKTLAPAKDLTAKIEERLLANPESPELTLDLFNLIGGTDREMVQTDQGSVPSAFVRTERLVRAGLEKSADRRLQYVLAISLHGQRKSDAARDIFKQLNEQPISAPPVLALQLLEQQYAARLQYALLLLEKASPVTDATQRNVLLDEAKKLLDDSSRGIAEPPPIVNMAVGRLLALRLPPQLSEASLRFDKAIAGFERSRDESRMIEALAFSARTRTALNELGAAAEQLERAIKLRPDIPQFHLELASLRYRLRQLPLARKELNIALKALPDSHEAQVLHAGLLTSEGKTEEALAAYQKFDLEQHPELALPLAGLLAAQNQSGKAISLLEQRLAADPKNLRVLATLLKLNPDKDKARDYLQTARQGGADAKTLSIVEAKLEGKSDSLALVEELMEQEEDPLRRHQQLWQLHRQTGKVEEAKAELAAMAKISPDHPFVVEAQFDDALSQQNWREAEALATRAQNLNLDTMEGMLYFGRLEMARGRSDRAIADFQRGLDRRPIFSDGWRWLGDAQRDIGDFVQAAASYKRALEQRPDNVQAMRGLAATQDALGEPDDALEQLRTAIRYSSDPSLVAQYLAYEQRYGKVERVLELRQGLAQRSPKNTANRRNLALLLSRLNKTPDALKTVDALIQDEGPSRDNLATKADILRHAGKPEEGRKLLQDYVDGLGNKAHVNDWLQLGQFLTSVGQDEASQAAFRKAAEFEDPKLCQATRLMADRFYDARKFDEAAGLYQKVYQANPKDRAAADRYVESLLNANRTDDAERTIGQIVKDFEADATTYALEAMVAANRKDIERALSLLDKAIEASPRRPVIYMKRAQILSANPQRYNAAVKDLNKALELDPSLAPAYLMLGSLARRQGNYDEAIRYHQMLLKRSPYQREARLSLADLYHKTRQYDALRQLLEESAKRFPEDAAWPVWQARERQLSGKPNESEKYLRAACKLTPSPANVGNLALFLIQAKRYDEVLELLRGNAELVSAAPLLQAIRGRALAGKKLDDQAAAAFTLALEQARELVPLAAIADQLVAAYGLDQALSLLQAQAHGPRAGAMELAMAQLEVSGNRQQAAVTRLRRVAPMIPDSATDRLYYDQVLGAALQGIGAFDEAKAAYERFLKLAPNNPRVSNNLAYLLADSLNRPQEALPLAQQAAQLEPEDPQILDTLGWTQFKLQQLDEATLSLQKSYRLQPSAATAYHLAEVLQQRQDKRGAQEMLESAKRLAEESKDKELLELINKRLQRFGST